MLVLAPAIGLAHGALRSSTPASGAHLTAVPQTLRLTFNEPAVLAFSAVELRGPDGERIALGTLDNPSGDANTLIAPIVGPISIGGTYRVLWRMAGPDGHPVRGEFLFVIAPGASGFAGRTGAAGGGEPGVAGPAPGQSAPTMAHDDPISTPLGAGFDAASPAYVGIRWLQYTALLLVIGAVAFRHAVLGFLLKRHPAESPLAIDARNGAATVGLWGAGTLALTALLRLFAQSYALHGPASALDLSLIVSMLLRTLWGWGWLLQLAGVVLALAGFLLARRGGGGWALATAGAVALAGTPALSGHAAAVPDMAALTIVADTLHVIGAGGWLGSLLVLVGVGVPLALRLAEPARGPAVADLVNAFSPTALVFAGLAGATGVFAAWMHLGSVSALWQTDYGRTLLVKLAVLSIVAATGAYNWLRVRPALGDAEGGRRIRRSGTVELAVGVVVLLVTAVLVATPTGKEARMQAKMRAEEQSLKSP